MQAFNRKSLLISFTITLLLYRWLELERQARKGDLGLIYSPLSSNLCLVSKSEKVTVKWTVSAFHWVVLSICDSNATSPVQSFPIPSSAQCIFIPDCLKEPLFSDHIYDRQPCFFLACMMPTTMVGIVAQMCGSNCVASDAKVHIGFGIEYGPSMTIA